MDKLQHFSFSLYMTTAGYYIFNRIGNYGKARSQNFAAGISISLGIGKESHDLAIKQQQFSIPDLIADLAGTALGLFIINRIDDG
ncbi:MAG: hypothetical protein K9M80_01540 [Candidatus Marinimicrobia bacterium]|nr:hypothetical protein [Candidatus Neomarinimicrobiota bacterium]